VGVLLNVTAPGVLDVSVTVTLPVGAGLNVTVTGICKFLPTEKLALLPEPPANEMVGVTPPLSDGQVVELTYLCRTAVRDRNREGCRAKSRRSSAKRRHIRAAGRASRIEEQPGRQGRCLPLIRRRATRNADRLTVRTDPRLRSAGLWC